MVSSEETSITLKPVTHTAEADVKSAVKKFKGESFADAAGSISKKLPIIITIKNEIIKVRAGFEIIFAVNPARLLINLIIFPNKKIFLKISKTILSSSEIFLKPICILKIIKVKAKISTAKKSTRLF